MLQVSTLARFSPQQHEEGLHSWVPSEKQQQGNVVKLLSYRQNSSFISTW